MANDIETGVESLLAIARNNEEIADRVWAVARELMRGVTAADVAAAIAERSGTLQTAVARLSDLVRGKDAGRRWLLDATEPARLAQILAAASFSLDEFRARVEILPTAFHPAWPELPSSAAYMLDAVPGLSEGSAALVRRVRELSPGSVFVIAGPPGAGVKSWLRRLEQERVGVAAEPSAMSRSDTALLIPCRVSDVARLREQARSTNARVVLGASSDTPPRRGSLDPSEVRPDVMLGAWGHRQIAEIARRLASSHVGGRLGEMPAALWRQIASLTQWTPLELGYALRGLAEASAPATSIAHLGSALVHGVARARCATVDPAIVDEAFTALVREVFERSPAGRWPSPLSDPSVREVLERVGEGAHRPIGRRLMREQALLELERAQKELEGSLKVSKSVRAHLRRVKEALLPPPPQSIRDALVSSGLVEKIADDFHVTRIATLVTAGNASWEQLLDRAGDPSLHRVMMAAIPRLTDTAGALDVFLRRGPARQLLDLRVALAVVARADTLAETRDARSVVGTAVALLEGHADCPWLTYADDVVDDLRRASQRYGASLAGELEVLDAAARWLDLAAPSAFPSWVRRESLLPWQHLDAFLVTGAPFELPNEVSRALLESALAEGIPRAREIVSGTADDDCAHGLGRQLPVTQRLELLSKHPPAECAAHAMALMRIVTAASGDEPRPREAIIAAVVALLSRPDCPATISLPLLPRDEWLEAVGISERRDVVQDEWRHALRVIEQALGEGADLMAESRASALARGGDPDGCLALGEALAELGDLTPLRTLASFARDDLMFDPRTPPRARLRALLGDRAARALLKRRDAQGLRALLPASGERTVAASAIDASCDVSLDDAIWSARELRWWRGIERVLEHTGDSRCLELIRRWAHDSESAAREGAIRCLVLRQDAEDADLIVSWIESDPLVLSLLPELLGHPSRRVRNAALRWLSQRVDGDDQRALWPGASNRYYVADRMERTAAALVQHARHDAPRLMQRLVETLAAWPEDDGRASSAEPSMRKVFADLVALDSEAALELLVRLETRGRDDTARRLAREWLFDREGDVPEDVIARIGAVGSHETELLARRMPREDLVAFVAGLENQAWVHRDFAAGETVLGRHPFAAIRALATRAPEVVAEQARTRCARLARTDPTSALAIAEWLVDIDSASAAEALDLVLEVRSSTPRRSRKKGRVS